MSTKKQSKNQNFEMLASGANPKKILKTLGLNDSKKLIKNLYNQKQKIEAKNSLFVYDQNGLEAWASLRKVDIDENFQQIDKDKVIVLQYELNIDNYFILFSTVNLIKQMSQFAINLDYIGIMIDGT